MFILSNYLETYITNTFMTEYSEVPLYITQYYERAL